MDPYRSARKVETPRPTLPRDLGMSSLGLVMVLGAFLSASAGLAIILVSLLAPTLLRQGTLAWVGLGLVVRAGVGGWAGRQLVVAHPKALAAVRTAGFVALAQTAFTLLLATKALDLSLPVLAVFLVSWPGCYLALSQRRAVRALWASSAAAPKRLVTRDLGMEAAGVLAYALGLVGCVFAIGYGGAALVSVSSLKNPGAATLGTLIGLGFLAARSILHLRLAAAARARDVGAFAARSRSYRRYAWVLAALTTLGLLLVDAGFGPVLPVIGLVVAWPLTLRIHENQVARTRAKRRLLKIKPSEEFGATALGFLLLGVAALWIPLAARSSPLVAPTLVSVVEIIACVGAGLAAALGWRSRRTALLTFGAVSILATAVHVVATLRVFSFAPKAAATLSLGAPIALEAAPLGLAIATLVIARRLRTT